MDDLTARWTSISSSSSAPPPVVGKLLMRIRMPGPSSRAPVLYRTLAMRRRINCDSASMIAIERVRFDGSLRKPVQRMPDPEAANGHEVPPRGTVGYSFWRGSCANLRHEEWQFYP